MPMVKTVEGNPFQRINELISGCTTLLDVGAGIGISTSAMRVPVRIGIDVHRPYLLKWPTMEPVAIPLNLAAQRIGRVFLPKTVDAVCFIDSLEHLSDQQARITLRESEAIARRIVIIFTPRGAFPQQNFDAWGMGGERYQQHRSIWEPEDLIGLGYDVLIYKDFHGEWSDAFRLACGPGAPPVDALLAYKTLLDA